MQQTMLFSRLYFSKGRAIGMVVVRLFVFPFVHPSVTDVL